MLRKLRAFLRTAAAPEASAHDPAAARQLAVAALLVEIARADHHHHEDEHAAIASLLMRYFGMDAAEADELLQAATLAVDDAVSLREFTAPLHAEMDYGDKQAIIGMLWDVALEDRQMDRYEDYLIGKVAELLYVSRGDVVRLRFQAEERRRARDGRG